MPITDPSPPRKTKTRPIPPPNVKFSNVMSTIQHIREAAFIMEAGALALMRHVREHEESVDQRIAENGLLLDQHINSPDLRPKIVTTVVKGVTTIALNDQIYRFGPRPTTELAMLADDDDNYFWTDPSDVTHYSRSNVAAILSILEHYSKKELPSSTSGSTVPTSPSSSSHLE